MVENINEKLEDVSEEQEEMLNTSFDGAEKLRYAGVPEEVIAAYPKWKERYGGVRAAFLGDSVYIFRKMTWSDMRQITNTLTNLGKSPNATEASLAMADLELQLEKVVLYPKISSENLGSIPAGDIESLQALITEYSGYQRMQPVVEDL